MDVKIFQTSKEAEERIRSFRGGEEVIAISSRGLSATMSQPELCGDKSKAGNLKKKVCI